MTELMRESGVKTSHKKELNIRLQVLQVSLWWPHLLAYQKGLHEQCKGTEIPMSTRIQDLGVMLIELDNIIHL